MEDLIKDEVLGALKYHKNNFWVRPMDAPVLNSEGNLKLVIQDDNKEGILDVQREAYKIYLQNEEKYKNSVTDFLLDYYKWNYEYIAREVSDLEEGDHKDVVTEKQLYEMIDLWYLYICRDGSFGYAFGCCWDDENDLAVLLSESEPRVISLTQLEHLHKLNDPTLGLLVHDGKKAWKGLERNKFFGKLENLEIELEGGAEEGITPAQQKAYEKYLQNKSSYFREFTGMMLGVYLADEEKAWEMIDGGSNVVVSTALPKTLFIDRKGNFGWECYTEWDKSYIGLLLSEEKPYWLFVDRLRNYANEEKVKDEAFGGILFPGYLGYESVVIVRLLENKVYTLPLNIKSYDDVVNDEMRRAYYTFVMMRPTLWCGMKDKMLKHYLDIYDDAASYLEIPDYLTREQVNKDSVMKIVEFTELFITDEGRVAWLAECRTDEEDGLAFEFTTGEIELISQQRI